MPRAAGSLPVPRAASSLPVPRAAGSLPVPRAAAARRQCRAPPVPRAAHCIAVVRFGGVVHSMTRSTWGMLMPIPNATVPTSTTGQLVPARACAETCGHRSGSSEGARTSR